MKVAAHARGPARIKDAIRAGIGTIEHASLIDDEGIRLAKQHGAWLSMNIYNTEYTQAEGRRNGVLEDNLRKDREVADTQRENFRKAHAAGMKATAPTPCILTATTASSSAGWWRTIQAALMRPKRSRCPAIPPWT